MGSDFLHYKIEDIAKEMGDAPFGSNLKNVDYTESGALVVQGKNIQGLSFDWSTKRHVSIEKWSSIPRSQCFVGDLIFPKVGTIGKVGILTPCEGYDNYLLSTNAMRLKVDSDIADQKYIYYYFSWNQTVHLINAMSSTSVQPVFNFTTLKKFNIKLPPLSEQKAIAHILGSLDDKIELNRQMNETLEAMAQALFKSWFVDFDPVIDNALAAGNEIPDVFAERAEQRKQLESKQGTDITKNNQSDANEINQLFPDAFEYTEEIGWAPLGWNSVQIKDLAGVIKGKSYKSAELSESKTALVTLKSFKRGGGYRLDGLKEYTGTYKQEQEVKAGDLIIAYTDVTQAADVIGKPAMVIDDARYDHLVISLDVAVVRPFVDSQKYYLYGLAQTEIFQRHTHSYSTGTTVLHLAKNAVPDFYLSLPSEEILNSYIEIVKPHFDSVNSRISGIRNLEKLRDTLLPKLLSGELRIPDAEKLIAEAQI